MHRELRRTLKIWCSLADWFIQKVWYYLQTLGSLYMHGAFTRVGSFERCGALAQES